MLSASPTDFSVADDDVTTAPLVEIRGELAPELPAFPLGLEHRIDPQLWQAVSVVDEVVKTQAFHLVPGSRELAAIDLRNVADAHITKAGTIHVYAEVNSFAGSAIQAIENLGLSVVSANERAGVVEAWVPYDKIDDLAALSVVGYVRLPMYGFANAGLVTSVGDSILNADDVRSRFDSILGNTVDGSGIKIGVISDGVDHRSQVQGGGSPDLPTVSVNSSRTGSGDEGTAMLEIIHDLAPGASLYFSSGIAGEVAMLDSIDWLVGQGVDVIVDDLGFLDQHYFSDDTIAQAVGDAIGEGVVYVSAAGNLAQFHYQDQWSNANGFHDFDTTVGTDNILDIGSVPNNGQVVIVLQWSDPLGASANDYDLGLWDGQNWVAASTATQSGTQDPLEVINWTNTTGSAVTVGIGIQSVNSPAPRELEVLVLPRGFSLANLADNDRTIADSLFGHAAVESAIAVAAIDASDSGNDDVETYSSQGPSTIYTNFASQISTTRDTVDGAGIDGVNTKIGDLGYFFDPFFGTSAAAPHVAAIAALMLDANPNLTVSQVQQFLHDTAIDLTSYGTGYDDVSGAGRFDALSAIYKAYAPGTPDLISTSDWGFSNTDNKTGDTTPSFSGSVPEGSHVWLYVNGTAVADTQLGAGVSTYSNLTPSTPLSLSGTWNVTIKVAENGSVAEANRSQASSTLVVTNSESDTLGAESFTAKLSDSLTVSGSNSGSSTLAIDWTASPVKLTKTGTGTLTVSSVNSYYALPVAFDADAGTTTFTTDTGVAGISPTTRVANWTINADANVTFTTSQNLAALNIEDGGFVQITEATPPNYKVLYVGDLDFFESTGHAVGTLDITNNALVIDFASDTAARNFEATVRTWLLDGRGGPGIGNGAWDGTGITSSTAEAWNATNAEERSIGYLVNADHPFGAVSVFLGNTVDSSTILVRYTVTGDVDLDGDVDDDDITVYGAGYNPGIANGHWALGDIDYNGYIDDDDGTLFGALYGEELET